MANQFGSYSPVVPSNVDWTETITLTDEAGAPIDLTGLKVQAQLRPILPVAVAGVPVAPPTLELTTPAFYPGPAPTWPLYAGWSVPTPANGSILLKVPRDSFLPILNPTNTKIKYVWDVVFVGSDGSREPVISGKPAFRPGSTF